MLNRAMADAHDDRTSSLAALDHAHVWHPFTPMRQWRQRDPLIIERGEGEYLIDTQGQRYIDGTSSLWCNVHGHRVPQIDQAIRDQLDRIAHSTMLGVASVPSIELAARLCAMTGEKGLGIKGLGPREEDQTAPWASSSSPPLGPRPSSLGPSNSPRLSRVFYSDAGATALEVAFKMAVGYWYHSGQKQRTKFIGFEGAYHGDTTGSMSVGYSEYFHKPFFSMVFPTLFAPVPSTFNANSQSPRTPVREWPSENEHFNTTERDRCLDQLDKLLTQHADTIAAVVIEPIVQGAAGMICQPPGFLRGIAALAKKHNTLFIADEVAVGFGRTGRMFACEHEEVHPDILCIAKGITGGYLPLAATLCTDEIEEAFCGEPDENKTFFHGHTYTGNPLACAAALASLDLFESTNLIEHIQANAKVIASRLDVLRDANDFPHVIDIRQRGIMVGIELDPARCPAPPADLSLGHAVCRLMRPKGLIIRPLGNTLVLMPIPAMSQTSLERMLDIVIETLRELPAISFDDADSVC